MGYVFSKWQGAGNDFIIVGTVMFPEELREEGTGRVLPEVVRHACDRHRGIGADGFMVLGAVGTFGDRVSMRYYNADGYPAEMCGNGARCAFAAARDWGLVGESATLETGAGEVQAESLPDGRVRIALPDVPTADWEDRAKGWVLNTGVPHLVVETENLFAEGAMARAPEWRRLVRGEHGGVNVNLCMPTAGGYSVRTYERGVEGETLACGTGAVAVALAMGQAHGVESPIAIHMPGGDLEVSFCANPETGGWKGVSLIGPAVSVAEGILHSAFER